MLCFAFSFFHVFSVWAPCRTRYTANESVVPTSVVQAGNEIKLPSQLSSRTKSLAVDGFGTSLSPSCAIRAA